MPTHDATLLLVEDEKMLLDLLTEHLEATGYTVVAVTSARAAWHLIEAGIVFDYLVSDIAFPDGMSGVQLAKAVFEKHGAKPTILISGDAVFKVPDVPFGDVRVLPKPFSPSRLMNLLEEFRNAC